ncbi:hypothetical protein PUNSTDRAFT_42656 [Punctularia strigosozonata HHB-11173 SS5]|uniref:uncharacterized protein n=1 Tax=Punctularia strigosozonata (strain HHB-11173) TaxID=741275 RepID=UPI000441642B|nr:uncharacterized protein PUNSTDRAFT_42656 [Punctularia strigosozonata HHB-11173 SS5]EIN11383.1 hypothetical protein PUNSTDRAFT_42656 [Punctularia strigosozonata HHB-11173 SS5]
MNTALSKIATFSRRFSPRRERATADLRASQEDTLALNQATQRPSPAVGSGDHLPRVVEAWRPMEQKDINRLRRRHGNSEKFRECLEWEQTHGAFLFQHLQPPIEEWEALTESERFLRSLDFVGESRHGCVFNVFVQVPHPDDLYRQCLYKHMVIESARLRREWAEQLKSDPLFFGQTGSEGRRSLRSDSEVSEIELPKAASHDDEGLSEGQQALRDTYDEIAGLQKSMDDFEEEEDAPTEETVDDGVSEGQRDMQAMLDDIADLQKSLEADAEERDSYARAKKLYPGHVADIHTGEPSRGLPAHTTLTAISENVDAGLLNRSEVGSPIKCVRHSRRLSKVMEQENGGSGSFIARPRARSSVQFYIPRSPAMNFSRHF